MGRTNKLFEKLTITDDYMFCRVMKDKRLCRKLLKMILGKRIGRIADVKPQHVMDEGIGIKSIRLDIYVKDGKGRIFDIEMQMSRKKNIPKRMRYYSSLIDSDNLNKGLDYLTLPDSYVIFLCPFDLGGSGLPLYTFQSICAEDRNIMLNDGSIKIIVNSKASDKVSDVQLRAFLEYMNGKTSDDAFVRDIEERIKKIKATRKWREEYMMLTAFEMDAKREGRAEGRKEGRKEGHAEGRVDELLSLVKDNIITAAVAASRLGETEEAFLARMQK